MFDIEKYLSNYFRGTKSPSLDAMKFFMKKLKSFEKEMKFIHIAGTNGKGSCAEMMYNILKNAGYKVGKYISPHLIRYSERITINSEEITPNEAENLIKQIELLIKEYEAKTKLKVTAFEIETIMALLHFYNNNVDIVVLETGLGGLCDCTNIITTPLVSIISSIGYDHMDILGNTIQEIAYQKAGIIKENSNSVWIEQEEVNEIIKKICKEKRNNEYMILKSNIKNYKFDEKYQYFDYKNYKNIKINLKGKKQIENAAICIETCEILNKNNYIISEEVIRKSLKNIVHKARMEVINKKPLIIYDGGHNEPAINNFQNMVKMYYKDKKRTYVISILKRKDYKNIIPIFMQDEEGEFIFTSGSEKEEYAKKEELYEIAKKYKNKQDIKKMSLNDACKYCLNNHNKINFIVGSFYIYGEVIENLKKEGI